jgi:hypothetical protein
MSTICLRYVYMQKNVSVEELYVKPYLRLEVGIVRFFLLNFQHLFSIEI